MFVNAIVFDVTETRCKVFILYQQQSFKKPGAETLQLLHVNIVWNIMFIFFTAKGGKMWLVVIVVTIRSFLNMSEIDFFTQGEKT